MRSTLLFFVGLAMVAAACSRSAEPEPVVEVVAEGLLNPLGLAVLPDGRVLVAEEGTGEDDLSAGVSIIAGGRVDRVVSGLPSGRDSGDLSGVPMVGVSPDGATVYTAHFGSGGLLTFPTPAAKAVDSGIVLGPESLDRTMTPLNRVEVMNPFDIAFAPDGAPVVTDASGNGVATTNPDGTTEFIHRFGELRSLQMESLRIDAVPTGIARVGDEYYVTLTGGCPYPERSGRLVAVDGSQSERVVADELDMPIDVAVGPDGEVWLLEFARFDEDASCFTGEGYLPGTGVLSRLAEGGEPEVVLEGLDFPGSVAVAPDGSLYVSEVFSGRVLRIGFGAGAEAEVEAARPWGFADVAADVGLDFRHGSFSSGLSFDPAAAMGAGLCWVDYDGDGWLDLYLVNSHAESDADPQPNVLYRNDDGRFTRTDQAGLVMRGNGCVAFDYDGDGDTDLYVTADGPDALLRNDAGGFAEVPSPPAGEWNTAAVAGDVDGDGWTDLYVASYIDLERTIDNPSGAFPQDYLGLADHLYMNNGDGTFTDEAAARGLTREDRSLGALLTDADGDGDLDLYVANDGQPNRLYENDGAGSFTDVTQIAGVGDSGSGMGIAGGDYDGDGAVDLFVTNWERELHALYRSRPDGSFLYSTFRIGLAGLGEGDTGWGTSWADFDHDTDLDLFVANGRVPVTDFDTDPELAQLFGNLLAEGRPGELRDWSAQVGLDAVGPLLARGAAAADYDNDGDLDVAVSQVAGSAVLLENRAPPGRWLIVDLDPFVPGTLVTVTLPDGTELVREARAGGSYLASEDPRLHFGLGDAAEVGLRVGGTDLGTVASDQVVVAGVP